MLVQTGQLLPKPFAYVIMYELTQGPIFYSLLAEELKKSEKWMNYLPNVWLIMRREPLTDLTTLLRSKIYTNDKLLVMPAIGPVGGMMPPEVWEWINENVPRAW